MPFGNQLRANDDIRPTLCNLLDPLFQRPRRAKEVRGQHGKARFGEMHLRLFGQPLYARANGGKLALHLTAWAGLGHGFAFAALMAQQTFLEPVLHHTRVAMIATDLMPTGSADRHRRIAPAVDKQKRLLAFFQTRAHFGLQRWGNPLRRWEILVAHVDGAHIGQDRWPKPRSQLDPIIFTCVRVCPTLKAWRCRCQHNPRAAEACAQNRHIAGVIEHAVILLVRGVMLFIDDDQSEVLIRQKQRRARTDNDLRAALPNHPPDAPTLGHGHARMPFSWLGPKPRLNACQKFRRKGDFWQ